MTTEPARPAHSAPPCAAPGSSGGVLVVEDDPCSRDVMVRLLKMLGYSARPAGDGFAALEEARHSRPDLVLMDLSLPGIDGLETIRRFRTDPALAAVPIIALTGNVSETAREAVCEQGAAGFLEKPVDLPALQGFLDRYVSKG